VLWASGDDLPGLYGDVLAVWRGWAADRLEGGAITSGHHMAEEAPEELATALRGFWAGVA
jgi:haloacetate dehalogenase